MYLKTHAAYIALIVAVLICGRIWMQEHDARVIAENTVKSLQEQIKSNDSQAAQQVKTVVKIVHDSTTPAMVVKAVPQLTDVPLNGRVAADNPSQVSVDALPLLNVLGQAKEDSINLVACRSDLQSTQQMVVALKKKPKFFNRVKHVAEAVGIGVGIGLLLGGHL